MLFCCPCHKPRNVETSRHKHFAILSRHQQTPLVTASEVSQLVWRAPTASYLWHLAGSSVNTSEARCWLRIAISVYPTSLGWGGSCRNIAMLFGVEKLEWCGYPVVQKFRRYLYSFWQNVRTWWTDTQTDAAWRQRPRLMLASCGKNKTVPFFLFTVHYLS